MARDWLCGCETFVNVQIEGDFVVHAASGEVKSIGRA